MRQYRLKMNPLKCAFGVSAIKFLGFIIHQHGIEIDPEKRLSRKSKLQLAKRICRSFSPW
jgi:hypothetical protein